MAFTVTATQGGASSAGMGILLKVITGQAASPIGATAGNQSATPNQSITPTVTGSWIYGAQLILGTGTPGVEAGVTFQQDVTGAGLNYIAQRSTSTQTSGTPILMGSTDSGDGLDISLAEITPGTGLAEDASSPAGSGFVNGTAATTAAFTPPGGSLLVLMVATNGAAGTTTMAITDTSGLSLTWTPQQQENGNSKGYAGVWTALVPAAAASGTPQALATVRLPRRRLARAVTLFTPVQTVNAHGPNGTVQPRATVPVPRRARARVAWSTNVIVRTVNGAAPPGQGACDDYFRNARTRRMYA